MIGGSPSEVVGIRFVFGRTQKADVSASSTIISAINAAGFPAGSVIEIVLLNGSVIQGAGGAGGGIVADASGDGFDGGDAISSVDTGVTMRVYITGVYAGTGLGDSFSYTCDGGLHAPGGGGASWPVTRPGGTLSAGGGAGSVPGKAQEALDESGKGNDGNTVGGGGLGGTFALLTAGKGGDWGLNGEDASDAFTAAPGLAGKAVSNVSGTVEIYGTNITSIPDNGPITEIFHRGSANPADFTLIDL